MIAAIAGALLGPGLLELHDHILGVEDVDGYGTQWFYWVVYDILGSGQALSLESWTHDTRMFHPFGKDIFRHTGSNLLDAAAAAPLRALLGAALGYNAFVIGVLALNGLALWWVAGLLVRDPLARGVAGAWFAAAPLLLFELVRGRPTQAIAAPLVLFIGCMWSLGVRSRWRDAVYGGFWLALSGYFYWFYAFFGGFAALAHGIWRALAPPPGRSRAAILTRHALMAAVALLLCAPAALPLAADASSGAVPGLIDVEAWTGDAFPFLTREGQVVGVFTWQPLMPHASFLVLQDNGDHRVYVHRALSLVALASLLLTLWRPGPLHRGPLLAILLAVALISSGPMLMIGTGWLPNPVYISLTKALSFLQRLWWPGRAVVVLVVLSGLACAVALAWIGRRSRRWQLGVVVGGTGVLVAELASLGLAPLPRWDAAVPAGYSCLADGAPGAVIELPWGWNQAHLYYQTRHGRPILGGMLQRNPAFVPREVTRLVDENAFLGHVLAVAAGDPPERAPTAAERRELWQLGYRYVVIQHDAFHQVAEETAQGPMRIRRSKRRRALRRLRELGGRIVYDDARITIAAPWGDPRPCARDAVEPDTATRPAVSDAYGSLGREPWTPERWF